MATSLLIRLRNLTVWFWSILLVTLIVRWITNDLPLGQWSGLGVEFASVVLVIVGLTIIYGLFARRVFAKKWPVVLYILIGLWPIWMYALTVGKTDPNNFGFAYAVFQFLLTSPEPIAWAAGWPQFIAISFVIHSSLLVFAAKRQGHITSLLRYFKISLLAVAIIIGIFAAHTIIPSPAERSVISYLKDHYAKFEIKDTEWLHTCCMQTVTSTPQRANKVIYTVVVTTNDGTIETQSYGLRDTNRDNEFNSGGGYHDWSEVMPLDEAAVTQWHSFMKK